MSRFIASLCAIGVAGVAIFALTARGRSCQRAESEIAVHQTLRTFFNSGSDAARNIAAELRQDGMTDEFYEKLKNGCEGCFAQRGNKNQGEDPDSWYVATLTAPEGRKRAVIFEVECTNSAPTFTTLYGG